MSTDVSHIGTWPPVGPEPTADHLTAVVQGAEETMEKMRAALDAGGIEVRRLARIRPSLEDAFVALTTRGGNDNSERPAQGSPS